MKKLISMILAVLMAGLCACGTAEDAGQDIPFLRIREGVTAQVFEKPGDGQAADTIPGGRICGLLGEETAEAGDAWFRVFYLNSQKAGATGYISAEDAEKLTEAQLKALMEDPAVLNEILDLIDAMNAYLSKDNGDTGNDEENGNEKPENGLETLYEKAMAELKKLFGTDLSAELDSLAEEGKELANKAKEAGEELKEDVTEALSSVDAESIGETIDSLKDSITETVEGWIGESDGKIDEAIQEATEALKELDTVLGESTGSTIDDFSNFVNATKDWLNGTDFSKVNEAVSNLAEVFKGSGFTEGTGANGLGSFLDELSTIFSPK